MKIAWGIKMQRLKSVALLLLLITLHKAHAQQTSMPSKTNTNLKNSQLNQEIQITTLTKKKSFSSFALQLENGTTTKKDRKLATKGHESYLSIVPGYRFNKKITAAVGAQYTVRQLGGTEEGKERVNRDHLSEIHARLLWKPWHYRDNGIGDFRFQFRVYSEQDDFFQRFYGENGNYQIRAFYGRPLWGKWSINKYTTYLRYKNYFNNQYAGRFTRDYELKAQFSPTYSPFKGLNIGPSFAYNHYFKVQHNDDEEVLDIDASIRYQEGPYATIFNIGTQYMNNNGGTTAFKRNENTGKDYEYSLIFSVFL